MADDDVELLGLESVGHSLSALLFGQVRQQILNGEHRVGLVFADDHGPNLAVRERHHAMQRQGTGQPLIFVNAAVVVGLGLAHPHLFDERTLLEVQPGAVGVGADQMKALGQGATSSPDGEQGFAVQAGITAALVQAGAEARFGQTSFHIGHGFPFGLAGRKKFHIAFGQGAHGLAVFGRGIRLPGRLGGIGEFAHEHVLGMKG